jgi:formate hydrogenlyase subunit 3/multisubunit Na+/H+ antiporter MnhD subunit
MAFGKTLIILGVVLIAMGLLWTLGARIGLGRLPGDIVFRGERTTFIFPVVTCLVLSILMSLALWLVQAFRR